MALPEVIEPEGTVDGAQAAVVPAGVVAHPKIPIVMTPRQVLLPGPTMPDFRVTHLYHFTVILDF